MTDQLTEKQKTEICSILGVGGTRQLACNYVGCTLETLIQQTLTDDEFAASMAQSEAACEKKHLYNLFNAAGEPKNWHASAWLLERVFADRYAKRKPATVPLADVAMIITNVGEALIGEISDPQCKERMRAQMFALRSGATVPAAQRGLADER